MIPLSAASTERFHTVVLDVVVEMGVCRLHVRAEEEKTYAEREDAEDSPTDETEVEQEEFHLVAAHHTHAFLYGCIVAYLRVVPQNEFGHAVGIALHDAGNNKKQRPKDDIDILEQSCQGDACEVLVVCRTPLSCRATPQERLRSDPIPWDISGS